MVYVVVGVGVVIVDVFDDFVGGFCIDCWCIVLDVVGLFGEVVVVIDEDVLFV